MELRRRHETSKPDEASKSDEDKPVDESAGDRRLSKAEYEAWFMQQGKGGSADKLAELKGKMEQMWEAGNLDGEFFISWGEFSGGAAEAAGGKAEELARLPVAKVAAVEEENYDEAKRLKPAATGPRRALALFAGVVISFALGCAAFYDDEALHGAFL
jgi:hypothetical protein